MFNFRLQTTSVILFLLAFELGSLYCTAAPKRSAPKKQAVIQNAPVPASEESKIDSATVRKKYLDGDFEDAIFILESDLKEKRRLRHDDSVFIYKHLGVMYAARYETREKGKYFMHQLLMTEPTAKIMDMYASDMIYMIFKNIQDEFQSNRMRLDHAEQLVQGNQQSDPLSKNDSKNSDETSGKQAKVSSSNSHAAYWWLGGVVLAAGIGGGYYLYSQSATPAKDKEIVAR